MELFDEMEKHFPELEKCFQEFMADRDNLYCDPRAVCQEIVLFKLGENGLREGDRLHTLFCKAGVSSEYDMCQIITQWLRMYMCTFNRNRRISRADIFPVQE